MTALRIRALAGAAGAFAAVQWAAYYVFVLLLPSRADLLILEIPFLSAGLAFLLPRPGNPAGGPVVLLRTFASPGGLLRGGMLLLLQVDVIVSTRWAGAVDASLATLLADVVATPLLVYAFYREDADKVRALAFWSGVVIASAGAAVTILAGGSSGPLSLTSGLVLVPLPLLIAVYFVAVNQECKRTPSGEVLGAAGLMAFALGVVPGLFLLGPSAWTVPLSLLQVLVLVVIGLTSFFLAPWAYFWAAGRTTIVIPAVLQALIPVFTVILVGLLGLESVPELAWVGIPMAFGGSVLALYEREEAELETTGPPPVSPPGARPG